MKPGTIGDLLGLLTRLKAAHIHYSLSDHTEDAIMIEVSVPGERWEVEFHQDGRIRVEVFTNSRGVRDAEVLDDLFRRFSD